MSKTLDEIRQKIDSIDNQLHDLLMERADLVSGVAKAKKEKGLQIVQPAREARMVRRLLARHDGPLPQATIVRIWRELVGSVALLQTGLSVVVSDQCSGWDAAKDYFGSSVPMKSAVNSQNAISSVLKDESSFAVLPWPELDDAKAWWRVLFDRSDDERLSVICAFPYGRVDHEQRAFVLSKIKFMPSDDDITLIGLSFINDISRAKILDMAKRHDLDVLNLYKAGSDYLLEVSGYFEAGSDKVKSFSQELGDDCSYCEAVGGYPVIPDCTSDEHTQIDAA